MQSGDRSGAVERWDAAAAYYEDTIEKATAFFVNGLLERLLERDREQVVDVACGTGIVTLALAEGGARVLAIDHSSAMVSRTRARVDERGLGDRVTTGVEDATSLDLPSGYASAAVSNHGIIFCPDVDRAISEMARVTRVGGVVALTAWTPMEHNGLRYWLELDPEVLGFPVPQPEGFAFSDIDALEGSLTKAGLVDLQIDEADGPSVELPSWKALRGMLKSPAFASMFDGLDATQSATLEEAIMTQTQVTYGEGAIEIPRQAWIASGRVSSQ
ncbi:MAG: class I SAM-dependent methyltransferase [bacterium]|nr:class I SAM-dependent methyltransferase [bacterium]